MNARIAEARKALVAALGLVAQAVSAGVLHGQALAIAEGLLAAATAAGVWATPNKPVCQAPALPPAETKA